MTTTNTGTSANTALSISAPELTNNGGQITTTSLQIAQHFGKRHDNVLRDIRKLECSDGFRLLNFAESSYANEQGKQQPMFHITKDGFMFLAMGFTGKEAAQWKEAYITEFNRREDELTRIALPSATISQAQGQHLRELVQLVVESGKQTFGETWERLHRKMKVTSYKLLTPGQFDEACRYLGGKFDDTSIATLIQKHLPNAVAALPPKNAPQALPSSQAVQTLQLIRVITANGVSTVEMLPIEAIPELVMREKELFNADLTLKIASSANLRMMGNVRRTGIASRFEQLREDVRNLDAYELMTISQDGWMELGVRTALTNELATVAGAA